MSGMTPQHAHAAVSAMAAARGARTPAQLQRHAAAAVALVDPIADLSSAVCNLDEQGVTYLRGLIEAAADDELMGQYPTACIVLRQLREVVDAGQTAARLVTGD